MQVRLRLAPMYRGPVLSGKVVTSGRGTEKKRQNKKKKLKHTRLYTYADGITSMLTCGINGKSVHKIEVNNNLIISELNQLLSSHICMYSSFKMRAHCLGFVYRVEVHSNECPPVSSKMAQ